MWGFATLLSVLGANFAPHRQSRTRGQTSVRIVHCAIDSTGAPCWRALVGGWPERPLHTPQVYWSRSGSFADARAHTCARPSRLRPPATAVRGSPCPLPPSPYLFPPPPPPT